MMDSYQRYLWRYILGTLLLSCKSIYNACKLNHYLYICAVMHINTIVMEDVYSLSDVQIQKKIGEKIKAARLKQNITQDSLAKSASISRSSVQKVESGEIKSFDTFIRILRTLEMLDEIYHLCEEEQLSPSEYYDWVNSSKKAKRRRAVGRRLRKSGKCEILA